MTVVFHPVFSCPNQNNFLFVLLLNVLLPRVCILQAKLARLFDDDEVGSKKITSKWDPKITSKWYPKHRDSGQRTWFETMPLSGTADSGTGRVVTPWRVLRGGEIHTMGHHLPQDLLCEEGKGWFRSNKSETEQSD